MIKKLLIAIVLLLAGAVGYATYMMGGPRNLIGVIQYGGQAREGSLKVGDVAPDVELVSLGEGAESRMLSSWFDDRPLVLVFGSFT